MTIPDFDAAAELQFALELADLATAISMPHYTHRTFNLDWKANRTEVTEADREAELAISDRVLAHRPTHGLFGEDSAGVSLSSGRLIERSHHGDSVVWAEIGEWQGERWLELEF